MYGHSPEPFREHPRTWTWKSRSQLGIALKWSPSWNGILGLSVPQFKWFKPGKGVLWFFRHKWRKWDTASVYFIVLVKIHASFVELSVFASMGHAMERSVLVLQCYGNVCNYIPKLIWLRMECFLDFIDKLSLVSSIAYLQEWEFAIVAQMQFLLTTSTLSES